MVLLVLVLMMIYVIYQIIRNEAVYKIRRHWEDTKDSRYDDYDYDYMTGITLSHTWYGLKYPREKDYE